MTVAPAPTFAAARPETRCPHCQQQALSLPTKMRLGYAVTVPCAACARPVSVARGPALAVALPFLLGIGAVPLLWPSPLAWVALVAGTLAMFFLHTYRVSLVKGRATGAQPPPSTGRVLIFRALAGGLAGLVGVALARFYLHHQPAGPAWLGPALVAVLFFVLFLGSRLGPGPARRPGGSAS